MDPNRKRDIADRADLAGSVTTGAIGAGFGAAKLRDTYKEEHPDKFARGLSRTHGALRSHGVSAGKAARVAHFADTAKPHFAQLAIASGTAGIAAGAGRYSGHVKRKQANEARRARDAATRAEAAQAPVAKSAFGVGHPLSKASSEGGGSDAVSLLNPAESSKKAKKQKKVKPVEEVAETEPTAAPKPVRMRAAKANPSMPKAEQVYDEVRNATKSTGLGRHAPTVAAVAGGVAAGALIHRHHKTVSKSAFGVGHPELLEKGTGSVPSFKPTRDEVKTGAKKVGHLARTAATEHGKYLAGAAGVGSFSAVGGVLANRARKAAPAAIDRAVARKFPMPKGGAALAAGAAGVGTAAALAHERRKKETLTKSAFGVEHPLREAGVIAMPITFRQASPSTQQFDETGSLR